VPPPCIEHVASRFTVLLGVRLSLLRDGSGFLFQRLESPLLALDGFFEQIIRSPQLAGVIVEHLRERTSILCM
jgi:hypothetical protein